MAAKKQVAVPDGERVRRLREHLDLLRSEIDAASGQPFAIVQLLAQERTTLAELDALAPAMPEEKSKRDDLKDRRAARAAGRTPTAQAATGTGGNRKPRGR